LALRYQGFDVAFFADLLKALQAARIKAPDLLIIDVVMMPSFSGRELAIKLREIYHDCRWLDGRFIRMADEIRMLSDELDGPYGLIARFSDGTTGAYVVEELLELRPHREPVREPWRSSDLVEPGRTI
jgi:hypothetical protein